MAIASARASTGVPTGAANNAPSAPDLRSLVSLYQPRLTRIGVLLSYLSVGLVLYLGWQNRAHQPFSAESGIGYWLGIIGGAMMLLLLLYPLRKKARFMRKLGPVPWWFRMHMTFGVLGPVLVLFHCGFQPGSLNSTIALTCMLLVASSGLAGRYFYIKIHHGLYGHRASLNGLREDSRFLRATLEEKIRFTPELIQQLEGFEQQALSPTAGILNSAIRYLQLGLLTWWQYFKLRRQVRLALRPEAARHGWSAAELSELSRTLRAHVAAHLESVRKLAEFSFYERLFSLWHVFHFPLFLMLVISGLVHVVAVHMY